MRLGKTAFVHFISQILLSISGFIATLVIARLLGADTLGKYSLVVAMLFWLSIPTTAIASAVKKRISEGGEQSEYLTSGIGINGVIVFVTVLCILTARDFIDGYVGAPVYTYLIVLYTGQVIFRFVLEVLEGRKKVANSGILKASERVVRAGMQVTLIVLGFELAGILTGHVISLLIASVVGAFIYVDIRPRIPSRGHISKLYSFGRYSWIGMVRGRAFGWTDTLVLGFFVSSALIGIYEVAWTVGAILMLLNKSIRKTLFPEFSDLGTDSAYDQIYQYLNDGLVFVGLFMIPGLFGAIVVGPRVLGIYGSEFTSGGLIFVILIVARIFIAYSSQFVAVINGIDRPDVTFKINLVIILLNVVLNVVLIAAFGWIGAAIATMTSGVAWFTLSYRALSGLIRPPPIPFREIVYQLLASFLMAACIFLLKPFVPGGESSTVGLVGLGALIYITLLLSLSTRTRNKTLSLVSTLK